MINNGRAVFAIDHHGAGAGAVQLKITIKIFDKLDELFVNVAFGTLATRTNQHISNFEDFYPMLMGVSARLIQSAMAERLRPRQLLKLLNDCRHTFNTLEYGLMTMAHSSTA
ncbi:hypothetical protein [Pseudomonas arsenicoxydans]|uniref:hypothetical protein n=1 Tax=Pseudomonas arsenicoxydans TaxID=702115 RepID=UPI001F00056F|nr:hypothetical protein [Pseudomonas arsenicoxydans]